MNLVLPKFTRRETAGERYWSLLVPVWTYQGRGYDVVTDSFKRGPWRFSVRLTVAKSYRNLSIRLGWGSSYLL